MNERLAFSHRREAVRARLKRAPARPSAAANGSGDASVPAAQPAPRRRIREPADWAWRGLLLFTFVLFFRPQDQLRPLEALHLAEMFALLGIAGLVFGRLARGLPISRLSPEILGVGALAGAMLLSIPTSIWPGGSVHVFTDVVIKLFLIFVLLVNTLDRPERLDRITFLMVLLSGYVGLRAVMDAMRGVNMVEGDRVRGAIGGIFDNPNDLALNMVSFLPFAVLWMFRDVPAWKRAAAAASAAAMLATIVFTRSRGGVLGLLVMVVLLLVRSIRFKPAVAVALTAGILAAAPVASTSFWNRMESIVNKDLDPTGSRQARIDLLKEAWHVYLSHPVVGIGLGQFVNYDPENRAEPWRVTHNALLQVATELGTVGLVPFLYLLWQGGAAARDARRMLGPASGRVAKRGRRRPAIPRDEESLLATATAIGPSLAGWFVSAFFASVAFSWTIYYLLAIAAATRHIVRARAATAEPPALARAS